VLERAAADGCTTLACPSLGTGLNGFPLAVAAETAVATVAAFLDTWPPPLRLVRFWAADEPTFEAYAAAVAALPGWFRRARREDFPWAAVEGDPFSATRALRWQRELDADAADLVRAGAVAREMEEKWFIYEAAGVVHLHRSWTGFEIFSFRIREAAGGGAILDQLQVCDDPERYKGDDEHALLFVDGMVDRLASGRA
jgi:hypothetical protein